ncbi:MAG: ABC transporter ATP-binding protein [Desulfurococcales archaeon]|nr:ABC transporter ATP-binding protein [Desulfurococcales archaeon]
MKERELVVRGLEAGYGEMQVLWSVDIEVEKGSFTVILGPNGAGKTTLLKAIMGIVRPFSGKIVYRGEDVTYTPPHKKVEMGITLVPEGRRLFPELTVEENLILGAYTQGIRDIGDRLELVYNVFPRLKERRAQKAGTLSGGEQQMLAIGRALMSKPSLLMLDEPSQGLAPKLALEIVELLGRLREGEELTILMVEQNVAAALRLADFIYVLEQGRIVASGTPEEVASIEDVRKAYFGL